MKSTTCTAIPNRQNSVTVTVFQHIKRSTCSRSHHQVIFVINCLDKGKEQRFPFFKRHKSVYIDTQTLSEDTNLINFYFCIINVRQLQPFHKGYDLILSGGGGAEVLLHQRVHFALHQVVRIGELHGNSGGRSIQLAHQVAVRVRDVLQGIIVVLGDGGGAGGRGGRCLEDKLLLLGHGGRHRGCGGSRSLHGHIAFGGLGGLGRGGGHSGGSAVVQALHQRGVAKAHNLADGVGLAGNGSVHITLDDGDVRAGHALDHSHTAAGQEGDIARLGGVIALHVGALGAEAVDPAAVAGAGQQSVIGNLGILRHEGQEGNVPAGVGSAVPGAVAGIALLLAGLEDKVLLALLVADLSLGHGKQALAPISRDGRTAHRRSPGSLILHVMLGNGQGDGGQILAVRGIMNSDDQLVVAIGRRGVGQLHGVAVGGRGIGEDHAAVLDGLQAHRVRRQTAGDLRGNGHGFFARVHIGRRRRGTDRQRVNLDDGYGALRRMIVIMVMNFLGQDVRRRHGEEHDHNHQHGQTTMGKMDFHRTSS